MAHIHRAVSVQEPPVQRLVAFIRGTAFWGAILLAFLIVWTHGDLYR
jgi:hypothetical protein